MTKKLDKFVYNTFILFFVLFLFNAASNHFVCHYLYAASANDLDHYDGYYINAYDNFYQDSNLILSKTDNLNYNSFSYVNDYILQEITHANYLAPTLVSAFLPAVTKLNLTLSGLLLSSLAIYTGNKIFFEHNSFGGISSFAALNSSSSLPEDFEPNNLQKSNTQHSRSNFDNNHATDPKDSFLLPLDKDDEPSNKEHHLSDLKIDTETLELYRQRSQLKTEYKNALYDINELKIILESHRFSQKYYQVMIDYNMFILAVIDVQKQDLSKQIFDDIEHYQPDEVKFSNQLKAHQELAQYTSYFYDSIYKNKDPFLNPKSRQKIKDHQFKAKSLKDEFNKMFYDSDFMDFYSSYYYEFKFLGDQINDNNYLELDPTYDLNHSHEIQAKADTFDNDYTLKESIVKLNQSIDLSKLTIAKLLIDIDKTQLSVIHSIIVFNILDANEFLEMLRQMQLTEQVFSTGRFSNEQKELFMLAISQDILIASEKLSSVKNQLNSLYNEYGVGYEPSKFQEVNTKLEALEKESRDIKIQLDNLLEKYSSW